MIHALEGARRRRAIILLQVFVVVALAAMISAACQRAENVETPSGTPSGTPSVPSATLAATVVSSDPRDRAEEVSTTAPLRITFVSPLDHDAVERALAIEPKAGGSVAWDADTLIFSPSPAWQLDTRYRVALSIPSPEGKVKSKWETSFTTLSTPRVIKHAPTTGEKPARTDTAISFEFDRPVDEASFLQHLHVTPQVVGKIVRSGNTVSYMPIERLKTGLKYSVVLRAGVRDQRGLETARETSFQFTTMASPRVVSVNPGANSTASGTTVAVEFDRPMNRESVENAFSLYPPVAGNMSWQGNKLVFVADSLGAGTRYSIRIKPGAVRDLDDNYLLDSLQSDFVTGGQVALVSAPKASASALTQPSSPTPTPTTLSVASASRGPAPAAPAPALAPQVTATSVPQPTSTPLPVATATPTPSPTPARVSVGDLLSISEYEILTAHNAQRRAAGLPGFTLDPRLIQIARYRSDDLARRGYFSHTAPDGSTAFTIMDGRGIRYSWAGENLALNDASGHQSVEVAMSGWMASQGHRANILNPKFDYVGVGMATNTKGVKYYTVIFLASPR